MSLNHALQDCCHTNNLCLCELSKFAIAFILSIYRLQTELFPLLYSHFLLATEWNMQHSQSMHCKTLTQSPRLAIPRCMYCWSREGQDWTRSTNQGGTLVERSQGQLCSHETWWSPSNSVHSLCVCMCMCVHSACMHFHMCMHVQKEGGVHVCSSFTPSRAAEPWGLQEL